MIPKATPRAALVAALLLISTVPLGCFRHVVEQRQLPNVAYLSFPGVAAGAKVQAEGPRNYEFEVSGGNSTVFAVEAGRYRVMVTLDGVLVANRIVFVAAGETKEVTR